MRLLLSVFVALAGAILLLASFPAQHSVDAQGNDCAPRTIRTAQWPLTDFCNSAVDFDEIISGGPPKDGIPAVDRPIMETVEDASEWLNERSPVIVVQIDDDVRAYPLAILMWHEIANDSISGVPIAVTFCPLCNSSIVFDRRVDGEVLDFGVSGMLRNSDLIMYDRQTESWWQQFTGEGIVGDYTGTLLDFIPSQVVGFSQFAERFPEGLVMSRDTGFNRRYGTNPYTGYDGPNGVLFLFNQEVDPRLRGTERVLGAQVGPDNTPIAYPLEVLSEEIVINDTVGGVDVVAFWQPGVVSALDQAVIDESRDIGTAALFQRTLDDEVLTFSMSEDGVLTDEQTGSTWNLFGEAIEGPLAGESLEPIVANLHFWFAWAAFSPETSVYGM